jgi:hypothetical protein
MPKLVGQDGPVHLGGAHLPCTTAPPFRPGSVGALGSRRPACHREKADISDATILTGRGAQSSVWIRNAVAKPSVVTTPTSLPPCW